mgnify:CR=1 FL=1
MQNRPLTQLELDHEGNRQFLWTNSWIAVAGSSTCVDKKTATLWADQALKDFDERFPKPDVYEETQCGYVKKDPK